MPSLTRNSLLQVCATVAAFCVVAAGYGAKPSRVQRAEFALSKAEDGSNEEEAAYKDLKRTIRVQEEEENKMHLHQTLCKAEEDKQTEMSSMKEAKVAPVKIIQSKKFSEKRRNLPQRLQPRQATMLVLLERTYRGCLTHSYLEETSYTSSAGISTCVFTS